MSLVEAERLTLVEYQRYSRAFYIKQEDMYHLLAKHAFASEVVKSEKKVGKDYVRVYQKFEDFYDFNSALDRIFNPELHILKEDVRSKKKEEKEQSMMEINARLRRMRSRE